MLTKRLTEYANSTAIRFYAQELSLTVIGEHSITKAVFTLFITADIILWFLYTLTTRMMLSGV